MDDRYTHARYGTAKLWMRLGGTLRAIRASTEKTAVLARRYGVHYTTISSARTGKKWAHLN